MEMTKADAMQEASGEDETLGGGGEGGGGSGGGGVKKIKPPDYLQMRERESSLSFPLKSSDYTNANQTDKHKRPDK